MTRVSSQGPLIDTNRNKNGVLGLYMLVLDVDSGPSIDATFEVARRLGLFTVFYTTHSHGTTELRIKQDKLYKWCVDNGLDPVFDSEIVKKFLTAEAKYVQDVIDSAVYVDTVLETGGIQVVVSTRPIDKFRVVFLGRAVHPSKSGYGSP